MKNFIDYYYSFNIYNITMKDGKYFFFNEKEKYLFKMCDNYDILYCYDKIKNQLDKYGYFFSVIKNINNSYVTLIDRKSYVLLKLTNIKNDRISIFDIKTDIYIDLNYELKNINYFNWIDMWEKKVDYFESILQSKYDTYKIIFSLFHYFIGMAENAILYLKETEKTENRTEYDRLVISHIRLGTENELYDYYDPTNIIIDHPSRDISEYLKSMFINKNWDIDVLKDYLKRHKFSNYGIRVMISRIIFPSFFFDYLEIMLQKNNNLDLLYLETRVVEFQMFVTQIMQFLVEEYNIPKINWIIKKT